jgi:carbon storage regulator
MLVLSRRIYETFKIGEQITVTVLGIRGGQVRLGIAAPVDLAIHREEALYRIKMEAGLEQEKS